MRALLIEIFQLKYYVVLGAFRYLRQRVNSTLKTYGFHLIGHAILGGNLQSHIPAGKTIPM